jgi:hypothetical protein
MYLLHIGSSELSFPGRPEAGSPGFDLLKLPFREFEIDERMLAVRKMEQKDGTNFDPFEWSTRTTKAVSVMPDAARPVEFGSVLSVGRGATSVNPCIGLRFVPSS